MMCVTIPNQGWRRGVWDWTLRWEHMVIRLYKHLPLKIKKLDNFNRFIKEVKSALLKNSFYTLEEFLQANLV
jgi:uncharacterized linocin/CFP29 family protein